MRRARSRLSLPQIAQTAAQLAHNHDRGRNLPARERQIVGQVDLQILPGRHRDDDRRPSSFAQRGAGGRTGRALRQRHTAVSPHGHAVAIGHDQIGGTRAQVDLLLGEGQARSEKENN